MSVAQLIAFAGVYDGSVSEPLSDHNYRELTRSLLPRDESLGYRPSRRVLFLETACQEQRGRKAEHRARDAEQRSSNRPRLAAIVSIQQKRHGNSRADGNEP